MKERNSQVLKSAGYQALTTGCLRLTVIILLTAYHLPLTTSGLYGAFEDLSTGVRAAAMGGAFSAISDDANGIFYNPAGLYLAKNNEFTASYGRIHLGLDDGSNISDSIVAYINPLGKFGTAGIGMHSLSLSGLYSEKEILFSYGMRVIPKLGVGLTMKSLSHGYGSDVYTENAIDNTGSSSGVADPVFTEGKETSKLSTDLGIFYRPDRKYNIGFVIQNLNSPDLTLDPKTAKTVDKVEKTTRAGIAYMPRSSILSLEIFSKAGNTNYSAGFETYFNKKTFALRGGLTLGTNDLRRLNIGLGLNYKNYKTDYAFLFPLASIDDSSGIHRIAFSVLFGPAPKLEQLTEEFVPEEEEFKWEIAEVISEEDIRSAQLLMKNVQDFYRKGMYLSAVENINKALEFNPKHPQAQLLKKKIEPISLIIRDKTWDEKIAKITRKGITAYLENNADLSVNAIRYVTELKPDDTVLQQVFEVISKEFPEIAAKEQSIPGLTLVSKKLQQALENIYEGQYVQAVSACNTILELEEDNVLALSRLGAAYWAIGDFKNAKLAWKKVLIYDPDNIQVREFLSEEAPVPKVEKLEGKNFVRKYIVLKGDTPQKISEKFYGNKTGWGKIYEANKDRLKNRWSLTVGQELIIP